MLQRQAGKAENRIYVTATALKIKKKIITLHNDENWKDKTKQETLTYKDQCGRVMTSRFITAPPVLIILVFCVNFTLCCYNTT